MSVQAQLTEPAFDLLAAPYLLYSSLLEGLSPLGLQLSDIRVETGDGTITGVNVNFWMLDYGVLTRIRVDSIESHCPRLDKVPEDRVAQIFAAAVEAVTRASSRVAVANYGTTIAVHGQPQGLDVGEYLRRYCAEIPQGLGNPVGTGTLFYFGPERNHISTALTLDLSAQVKDGLFMRWYTVWETSSVELANFHRMIRERYIQVLATLGLEDDAG